jgi:hypothetical protein
MSSENPMQSSAQPNAKRETSKEAKGAKAKVTPTATSVQPDCKKSPYHCEITCKEEKNWWSTIKPFIEMAGIILLLIYTIQTCSLVKVSQRSSRPFVGQEKFSYNFQELDPATNKMTNSPSQTSQIVGATFEVGIKNYGPLPATNFSGKWQVRVDGVVFPSTELPQENYTLQPTEVVRLRTDIGGPILRDILSGAKTLTFDVAISYDGPEGHYQECDTQRYTPAINGVITTGHCKPF